MKYSKFIILTSFTVIQINIIIFNLTHLLVIWFNNSLVEVLPILSDLFFIWTLQYCRVQVKNKSDNIGNTTAKLNLMTNRCIPTAGEDINQISVSILINVGSGILEPCALE